MLKAGDLVKIIDGRRAGVNGVISRRHTVHGAWYVHVPGVGEDGFYSHQLELVASSVNDSLDIFNIEYK